jgi:hypothetical protein
MAARGNAAVIEETKAVVAACKRILAAIKGKETVQTATYVVEVARTPVKNGVHVPAQPAAAGAAAPQQRGCRQQTGSLLEVATPAFEVVRLPVEKKSAAILAQLKLNLQVTPVNDLFNDKLDFSVRTCLPPPPLSSLLSTACFLSSSI